MAELQPLISEMFLGSWIPVTSLIQRDNGQGIRISRKPLTWAEQVAPTTANWTFRNTDNDFYGRNPNSTYYGLLGRNTEVRHRLRTSYALFTATVSSAWPAADTGEAWTNTTTGGASASDYSSSSGCGRHTHTSVNVFRGSSIELNSTDQDITVDVKFDIATALTASVGHWICVRETDSSNHYLARVLLTTTATVTLGLMKNVAGALTTLDAGVVTIATGHAGGEWYTVRVSVHGKRLRAMAWPQGTTPPTTWQHSVAADDDTLNVSTGTKCVLRSRLETGNTNTLNVVASWDNFELNYWRFWGEIPSFSPVRDSTGRWKTVPVNAAGLAQRLSAGVDSLDSALTRAMDGIGEGDQVPNSNWPMEETTGAKRLGNLRSGGAAIISGDVALAGYSAAEGSLPVPIINNGGQISGTFPATTLEVSGSGESIWQIQFMGMIPSGLSANCSFLDINVSDTGGDHVVKFRLEWDNTFDILTFRPYDRTGVALTGIAIDLQTPGWLDIPLLFGYNVYQTSIGGIVSQQFGAYRPGVSGIVSSNSVGVGATTVVPVPQSWRAYANAINAGWSFSHLGYWTDPAIFDFPNQQNNAEALNGFTGELAGERMTRVGREENLPFELLGDAADTNACGPQRAVTVFQIFTDAANADQGILQDARDIFGLQYIPRVELERQPVAVSFSGTGSHDMESFQLVDDDRTVRNKITARRTAGQSFAVAEITEGNTSTAPPPEGLGTYPEDLPWNLADDTQLGPFAGWRALVKGWNEARYPATNIWRDRTEIGEVAVLDAQVLSMDTASHYLLTDMPEDLPPDDVGLLVQGYTELLANFEHRLTLDGLPSGPYDVLELDDDDSRADDDHELRSAVDDNDTAWDINNLNLGVQIIADDAQDGWQWMMDGELVTVTDVAAPSISFVGIGTASTGSSGSRTPGLPASIATGDLALIFASTRNSGTGIPQLAANWDQIYLDGNIALYARIYGGVSAGFMPTITYSGGAANEDTIAQSCAFRGKFTSTDRCVIRTVGCLNPSAEDITFPGVPLTNLPENYAAIYFGWRQDDVSTGVDAVSGATEIQETNSTAGNDAAQVWDYRLYTSRVFIAQGAFSVHSGGVGAISRGGVLVICSDYQTVTATRGVNGIFKSHDARAVPRLVPASHVAM